MVVIASPIENRQSKSKITNRQGLFYLTATIGSGLSAQRSVREPQATGL